MQNDVKTICGIVLEGEFLFTQFSVYFWKNKGLWKNEGLFKLMLLVLVYKILLFLSNGFTRKKNKEVLRNICYNICHTDPPLF